jgi:hypothetical protein
LAFGCMAAPPPPPPPPAVLIVSHPPCRLRYRPSR